MSDTRCISSQLMTGLLAWRNPNGSEEGWWHRVPNIDNAWKLAGRIIVTEVGIGLITLSAVIETLVYGILSALSLCLKFWTPRPYNFFAERLESSAFTIIWGIADAVIYNPLFPNVCTHESFARWWANSTFRLPIALSRTQDDLFIFNWTQQHRPPNGFNNALLGPILNSARETERKINEGAEFIKDDILNKVNNEMLESLISMDPFKPVAMFVATHAIYAYTLGSNSSEDIPDFFKDQSMRGIEMLRLATRAGPIPEKFNLEERTRIETMRKELQEEDADGVLESAKEEVEKVLVNFESFETFPLPLGKHAVKLFSEIRKLASREIQGSLLTIGCLQKAIADQVALNEQMNQRALQGLSSNLIISPQNPS